MKRHYSVWYDDLIDLFTLCTLIPDEDDFFSTDRILVSAILGFDVECFTYKINHRKGLKTPFSLNYSRIEGPAERAAQQNLEAFGSRLKRGDRMRLHDAMQYGMTYDLLRFQEPGSLQMKPGETAGFLWMTPNMTVLAEENPIAYHNNHKDQ